VRSLDRVGGELLYQSFSAGLISAALTYVAKHKAVCLEETLKNNRADSKPFASEF
jgi:hypothetical protein